jgi:hypothetical protein
MADVYDTTAFSPRPLPPALRNLKVSNGKYSTVEYDR